LFVDDEKVLRQLCSELADGKLEIGEVKDLDLNTAGRGMRRKYRAAESDDTDVEVYHCLSL